MKFYNKLDSEPIQNVLFHPRTISAPEEDTNIHNVGIHLEAGVNLGCRLFIHDKSESTILFFHGNGEIGQDYEDVALKFNHIGVNFLLASYRGYGWSTGTPSASTMMNDSLVVFDAVETQLKQEGFAGPLFIMGRSIGSASAIEIAHKRSDKIQGLVIESGFAETLSLLINLGLSEHDLPSSEKQGFENISKIEDIKLPTLILHGANDSIIPIHQAESLQSYCGARTKKFFIIPGAEHNTMIQNGGEHYFSTIKQFIDDITGKATWRNRRKKYREGKA